MSTAMPRCSQCVLWADPTRLSPPTISPISWSVIVTLLKIYLLHHLDVEVARIVQRIGQLASLEGIDQVDNRVFDRVARLEAELVSDLPRRHVIGAQIVGRPHLELGMFTHVTADHLGKLHHRVVLVASIVDLAIDILVGRRQQQQIGVGHVLDMDVGPKLIAAEHRNLALVVAEVGQDVDDDIEPLPGRVAAHRGRPDRHGREAGLALLLQQGLAFGLELGVVGQRLEREILGHFDAFLDAVDGRRRGIDEALDPARLSGAHQRHEGVKIDRAPQLRIELEGRIVGDAGEVDHRVAAFQRLLDRFGITDVALDLAQAGKLAAVLQHVLTVEVEVEYRDFVAGGQQLGHQHGADIARAARDEDSMEVGFLVVSAHNTTFRSDARHGRTALGPGHAVVDDGMAKGEMADLDVTVGHRIEIEIHVAAATQGIVGPKTAHRQHRAAEFAGGSHRSQNVGGLPGRADCHHEVAGAAVKLYLLGEHLIVAVVVGEAGQHAAVVHRPGPEATVLAVVGRHMTGDGRTAAVADEDDLAALGRYPPRRADRPFDREVESDALAAAVGRHSGPHGRGQRVDIALDQSRFRFLLPHEPLPHRLGNPTSVCRAIEETRVNGPYLANHFNSVDRYFKISGRVIWWRWPTILTFMAPAALPMKAAWNGSLPLATRQAAKAKKASPAPMVSMASSVSAGMRRTPSLAV